MVKQIINYHMNICCKNYEKEWETGLLPDTKNWKDRQIKHKSLSTSTERDQYNICDLHSLTYKSN